MPKKHTKKMTKAVKTAWDLAALYSSAKDPRIEKDVAAAERAIDAFAKKYGNDQKLTAPARLKGALAEYEKLIEDARGDRGIMYFAYRRELNARDEEAEKRLNQLSERLTKAQNKLLFFELRIGALKGKERSNLLADKGLAKYRYYLENIFRESDHLLTEPEERIMNLKGMPASELWIAGTEKIMNKRTVRFKGKDVPLQEAITKVVRLPRKDRHTLWNLITDECHRIAEIAENELNAVVINKKINDELRKYEKPYSATVLGYENKEASIEALVDSVSRYGFKISNDFYKLKAKLMGEKLSFVDRVAGAGGDTKIPFSEAVATLREVFYGLKPVYGEILDRMLQNGQVDVYPRPGKTGGAFCASGVSQPTMVLLNQVDDLRSLTTFAHEMGHAIHAERSKSQPAIYQGHSTAAAETASTLFENLVFKALLKKLSPKAQVAALHNKLDEDMASIMRQIAFFNFEKDLHLTIRKEGGMTREEMARLLQKHLKAQLGPAVTVTEADGYSFVYVSHFRRFFYVYTYAYGNLISNVLADRWGEDPQYIEQIDQFLTAGCSMSPEAIFKSIGVDTANPEFWNRGLARMEADVQTLARLSKRA
jgi:oligoendopeptidase F